MKKTILSTLTAAALLVALPFSGKAEPPSSAVVSNGQIVDARIPLDVNTFLSTQTLYTVPAGKKLVIERVGFHGTSRSNPTADMLALQVISEDSPQRFPVILRRSDSNMPQVVKLSRLLQADGGSDVQIRLKRLNSDKLTGFVELRGYLVDLP